MNPFEVANLFRTTPNHALQRTATAVTACAADRLRLSTHRHRPRQPPPSLSLGSLAVTAPHRTMQRPFLSSPIALRRRCRASGGGSVALRSRSRVPGRVSVALQRQSRALGEVPYRYGGVPGRSAASPYRYGAVPEHSAGFRSVTARLLRARRSCRHDFPSVFGPFGLCFHLPPALCLRCS